MKSDSIPVARTVRRSKKLPHRARTLPRSMREPIASESKRPVDGRPAMDFRPPGFAGSRRRAGQAAQNRHSTRSRHVMANGQRAAACAKLSFSRLFRRAACGTDALPCRSFRYSGALPSRVAEARHSVLYPIRCRRGSRAANRPACRPCSIPQFPSHSRRRRHDRT